MKTFQFLCLLLLINIQINAQNLDFKLIKDSLVTNSSGEKDSLSLAQTRFRLETFDTNSISKNIQLYYRELGRCYYRLYLNSKDTMFLTLAIIAYDKALNSKRDYSSVLWDISLCHYLLGHCKKGEFYLATYKRATPKKTWDKKKMELISKNCKTIKRNTIFLELFGNGYFYSINYERLFDSKNKIKIAARIGFEYHIFFPFNVYDNRRLIMVPIEVSGLYPILKKNHFLELGTGLTYSNEFFYDLNHADNNLALSFRLGYRFQKKYGGIFIKLGFTPFYYLYNITPDPVNIHYVRWWYWGGIGLGYTF